MSRTVDVSGSPLVCPSCAIGHTLAERFCSRCGTPLVYAPGVAEPARTGERAERARKVRPQYAEGELVRVAAARNQSEGELLQGMLLEEGVPSLMRRSGGFDVPDFLAAGPRDILVPASGAPAARDILQIVAPADGPPRPAGDGTPAWIRALAVAMAVVVLASVAAFVLSAVYG
jgi:hypothetical protein